MACGRCSRSEVDRLTAAPPAIGGIAWLAISGEKPGLIFAGFMAMTLLMVLVQMLWLPRYMALPYTLGMWSFTFPAAAVALIVMHWVDIYSPVGGATVVVIVTALVSLIVVMNVVRSGSLILTHQRGLKRAERDLVDADEAIGHVL